MVKTGHGVTDIGEQLMAAARNVSSIKASLNEIAQIDNKAQYIPVVTGDNQGS